MYKCNCCKIEKPFSEFNKNRSRRTGYSQYCKVCVSNRNKSTFVDHADHYRKNADYYKIKATFRKSYVKQATPKCLTTSQKQSIIDIYKHALDCSIITGEKYHVDHVVPLRGEEVCGLHVPWNLQVLPADINMSKGNRYEKVE